MGLTLLSVAGQVIRYTIGNKTYHWYQGIFDLNREQNVPTYFEGILLLAAAVLCALAAAAKGPLIRRAGFAKLSGLMLLLSIDEMCSLHEQLNHIVHLSALPFGFAWVIPGGIFAAVMGLIFLRFLLHLPAPTRWRFIVSGSIFIAGAVGMEAVSGFYAGRYGENVLSYQLLANLEEVLEMTGMSMFIVSALRYLAAQLPEIILQLPPDPVEAASSHRPMADAHPPASLRLKRA